MPKGPPAAFSDLCCLRAHKRDASRRARSRTSLYAPLAKALAALPRMGVFHAGLGGLSTLGLLKLSPIVLNCHTIKWQCVKWIFRVCWASRGKRVPAFEKVEKIGWIPNKKVVRELVELMRMFRNGIKKEWCIDPAFNG